MNRIRRITIGLALLAAITTGVVGASARGGNRQRTLNGVVQSVDLQGRTLVVREQGTDRVVTVRVPKGALVRTTSTTQPYVQMEGLMPGTLLQGVVVE